MASKNKSFSDAFAREPARMFITDPEAEKASAKEPPEMPETPEKRSAYIDDAAPLDQKYIKEKPETKSRRIQLLMKPSVYASIKAEAEDLDMSFNELVNAILERHAGL